MTDYELIQILKMNKGYPSDYKAAMVLGISADLMSKIKRGKNGISDKLLVKITNLLNARFGAIKAALELEKETDEEIRKEWTALLKKEGGTNSLYIM